MHRSEDEILAQANGAVSAAYGGSPRANSFIARRMRKNVHEIDLVIPLPFDDAVEHVVRVLEGTGQRIEPPHAEPEDPGQTIRVLTGGGIWDMNPVVVTAQVTETRKDVSGVHLRAAAKEGAIRQRAGEKTAKRLASWLVT
ncbi:hypothetical protein HNR23_003163 [Nocardiopsis mwathae]|uniref:Uncharacterized protein n=1 Tax=Nocardiopsis mwathae TaxID=1472723 RepID=A0A7X0D6A2_9ACTN|nr:hypothetical protein [Nocardiopsis mwathae]MBB6173103.1 hypothetical protein [Nocardiopsis mwathae]